MKRQKWHEFEEREKGRGKKGWTYSRIIWYASSFIIPKRNATKWNIICGMNLFEMEGSVEVSLYASLTFLEKV